MTVRGMENLNGYNPHDKKFTKEKGKKKCKNVVEPPKTGLH